MDLCGNSRCSGVSPCHLIRSELALLVRPRVRRRRREMAEPRLTTLPFRVKSGHQFHYGSRRMTRTSVYKAPHVFPRHRRDPADPQIPKVNAGAPTHLSRKGSPRSSQRLNLV